MDARARRLAHIAPSSFCGRLAGRCPAEMRGENGAKSSPPRPWPLAHCIRATCRDADAGVSIGAPSPTPRQEDEGVEAGAVAHCHMTWKARAPIQSSTTCINLISAAAFHWGRSFPGYAVGLTRNLLETQPSGLRSHETYHQTARHHRRGDKGEHPSRTVIAQEECHHEADEDRAEPAP